MSEMYVLDLSGFKDETETNEFLNNAFSQVKFEEHQGMAVFNLSDKGKESVKSALGFNQERVTKK